MVLVVLSIVCCGASVSRAGEGKLIRLRTAHYEIECDAGGSFTRELARHMEAIYAEYYRRLRDYGGKISKRFKIKVFDSREDYLRLVGAAYANSGGIYMPRSRTLASFVGGRTQEQVFRTLYHEGFHQFTDVFLGGIQGMPPWVAEGMAQLFEDATLGRSRFVIGDVPTFRIAVLRKFRGKDKWIPLARLVAMSKREWSQNLARAPELGAIEYQEAWSVVHFLVYAKEGKYRRALILYLKQMNAGKDSSAAFRAAFGSNINAFEKRWLEYVDSLEPTYKYQCRLNLEVLGMLLPYAAGDEEALKNSSAFCQFVRGLFAKGLKVGAQGEEPITAKTPDRINALLRCPAVKKAGDESGYAISADAAATTREGRLAAARIECRHHEGLVLSVQCVRDLETKRYRSIVEESAVRKKTGGRNR